MDYCCIFRSFLFFQCSPHSLETPSRPPTGPPTHPLHSPFLLFHFILFVLADIGKEVVRTRVSNVLN